MKKLLSLLLSLLLFNGLLSSQLLTSSPKYNEDLGELRQGQKVNVSGTANATDINGNAFYGFSVKILRFDLHYLLLASETIEPTIITNTDGTKSFEDQITIPTDIDTWPLDAEPKIDNTFIKIEALYMNGITTELVDFAIASFSLIEDPTIPLPTNFKTSVPSSNQDLGQMERGESIAVSGSIALINSDNNLPLKQIETSIIRLSADGNETLAINTTTHTFTEQARFANFSGNIVIPNTSEWPNSKDENGTTTSIYLVQNRAWYGETTNITENGDFFINGYFSIVDKKPFSGAGFVEASPTNFEDLGNLINGQIVPVSGKVALINNKNELPLYQIETSVERWANDWSNRIKVSSTQQYTTNEGIATYSGSITIPNTSEWPKTVFNMDGKPEYFYLIISRAWYGHEAGNRDNGDFYDAGWFYIKDSESADDRDLAMRYSPMNGSGMTNSELGGIINKNTTPSKIISNKKDILEIYPNPVTKQNFTINTNSFKGNITISIFNISGTKVYSVNEQAGQISIKTTLPSGLYTVIVSDDIRYATSKLIIK